MTKARYRDPNEGRAKRMANLQRGTEEPSGKMLAVIQSGAILPPNQIAHVRRGIVNIIERNLDKAEQVLAGTMVWNGVQANLFLKLLDKVAPNMSESLHRHTMAVPTHAYDKLSRAELEAALVDVLKEPTVIEVEPVKTEPKQHPKQNQELLKRAAKKRKLSLQATQARILETKPETVLAPLTREEDDENRRRMAAQAKGLRTRERNARIRRELELMEQMDPPPEAE